MKLFNILLTFCLLNLTGSAFTAWQYDSDHTDTTVGCVNDCMGDGADECYEAIRKQGEVK